MALKMAVCFVSSYLLFFVFGGLRVYTWVESRRPMNYIYPVLSDLSWIPVGSIFLAIGHRLSQWALLPLARAVIAKKSKWSGHVYESKLSRFGSAVFKFLFFILFSCCSWKYGLAEADWVPPVMFGKGSTKNCWGKGNALDTQQPVGTALKLFYQVAMAYHLHELGFQVMFERERPDFMEMILHHITTLFLVFTSFYANMIHIGTLVLLVHYVSDIPGYGCKIFVDTSYKIVTLLNYAGLLATWGYLRLYVFPVYIIRSTLVESTVERATFGDFTYGVFNLALSLLLCLHFYWYCMFLKMGYGFLCTGHTVDMQANLTSMDLRATAAADKQAKQA